MIHVKTTSTAANDVVLVIAAAAAQAAGQAPPPPADRYTAITGGRAHLDFRYRLETVDQDPFDEDATDTAKRRVQFAAAF
jgi:hypothetical protein